jgi:hypothetical protein
VSGDEWRPMPRGEVKQVFLGHQAYGDGKYVLLQVREEDDLRIGDAADLIVMRLSPEQEFLRKVLK